MEMMNLEQQLSNLAKEGWDKRSLRYYRRNYFKQAASAPIDCWQEIHEVGTPLYTKMLQRSWLPARLKIQLVLNHLGTYVDEHNFLQLAPTAKYHIWADLAPLAEFNVLFRTLVLQLYGKAPKNSRPLVQENSDFTRCLNLFRGYIDRQAISYLRQTYPVLPNDFWRLAVYAKQCGVELDFETGANYHNRHLAEQSDFVPENMKVQLAKNSSYGYFSRFNDARMVEFIINVDTLEFVSQWNVIKQEKTGKFCSDPEKYTVSELRALADTESFNYGIPHGKGRVPWRYRYSHGNLDGVNPLESDLRKRAKKFWHADGDAKKEANGYGDLVNSNGIADILCWQNVSRENRLALYRNYTSWLYQTKRTSTGIFRYYALHSSGENI
ncbi:DUF3114 domain-containing protein [Ligilactobacillus animalis]|uniref:DUF3114 domain-containing protein n=1 Tax=Ligilactobacillus animalis TaxID=1605 RepID=A0ABR4RNN0_9LACO|nr:DUF3114 domain-containing protein [Ligilactobacillus animalis]KDA45689.1 hypothetical protein Lani381_1314 [Ligilactobacillus animalis]MEE0261243.1 DUF3114 domain-containing protein [Ligilactobacillus animalis]PNQ52066.1 DUF3114 domain-containing protein [Ligilactobacillus animalis]